MAIPTYATVIIQINTHIIANGNNEITANVLNPVLKVVTDFANSSIGNLGLLTTTSNDNLVEAINSLKTQFDNLNNNGVQLLTGYDNPNITPPPSFNYADFYMELDSLDDSPIQLWQWSGTEWNTYSNVYSKAEIDLIVSNIYAAIAAPSVPVILDGIIGVTSGFAMGQTTFTLPSGKKCTNVNVNDGKYSKTTVNNTSRLNRWSQAGDVVTIYKTTVLNNYIYIEFI